MSVLYYKDGAYHRSFLPVLTTILYLDTFTEVSQIQVRSFNTRLTDLFCWRPGPVLKTSHKGNQKKVVE